MKTKTTATPIPTPTPVAPVELVTDVTPTSVVTNASALDADASQYAGLQWLDSYMKFGSLAWGFYGSLLEQGGVPWASWWSKWSSQEPFAGQIGMPIPGMPSPLDMGKSMFEAGAEMQARWLDTWQRFFVWTPWESRMPSDTGNVMQAAATVE